MDVWVVDNVKVEVLLECSLLSIEFDFKWCIGTDRDALNISFNKYK